MTNTYKCPKCNGSGHLACYAGIAGGVCFSCEGNGFKVGVAPVAGSLFPVMAVRKADAARVHVFNVKAKSSAEALRKAIASLSKGNGYFPESAEVAA